MPTRIQPTVNALQGDLTSLDPKKGAELIDKWTADMENADWRGAKTIHANLVALKKQLEGGAPDGAKIKQLLTDLGEETSRAANHVQGSTGEGLQQLGKSLLDAGNSL
ncbi:hypothetical protein [Deinococcus sp.]|uniref:hypothetical protein n=1 Tax=Deinococcus sp. TaxID=47478 RepID=UPI003C7C598A